MSPKTLKGGLKTTNSIQDWSDAKDCLVGNCMNIAESVRTLEKSTFC